MASKGHRLLIRATWPTEGHGVNGNTAVSKSATPGSNPGGPALTTEEHLGDVV